MPVPGWRAAAGSRRACPRQMVDAVRYLVAGGITWRAMPADFPAWDRVYAFFRRWWDKGLTVELPDRSRERVRQAAGRDAEPTAGIIDAQSVKAAASMPAANSSNPATGSCCTPTASPRPATPAAASSA
ncbi:transposase [Streptomyces prasinus]|uniref:transposase n=1 Tax=Streptomyces prasinus TaxID=67345 RepID=UPI0033ADF22D